MLAEKLYIHIGWPKTGTTAIQGTFLARRKELLSQSILYPCAGLQGEAHHKIAGQFLGRNSYGWIDVSQNNALFSDLEHEVAATSPKNIFLSSEAFYFIQDPVQLRDSLAGLAKTVELVIFLRRQDFWVESNFTQAYKNELISFDFDSYSKSEIISVTTDYNKILKRWENVFGIDKINLFLIDPDYGTTNALKPIYDLLEITEARIPPVGNHWNDRLSIEALHFVHHMLVKRNGKVSRDLVHDMEVYMKETKRDNKYVFMKEDERKAFMLSFEDSNAAIAKRYFNRSELFTSSCSIDGYAYINTHNKEINMIDPMSFILEKYGIYS